MSNYKYEYDKNVKLLIYHLTPQKSLLNFTNLLKFSKLVNIESFIIRFFPKKKHKTTG